MSDQNINIAFKTTADSSGADKTADDIKHVTEEIEAQGKAITKTGDEAEKVGPKLDNIVNLQRAQVAGQLGQAFAQIAGKLGQVSAEIAPVDRELSQTLENIRKGFEDAGTAAQGAMAGFMVAGPWGAAVGAVAGGVIVPALKEMTDEYIALAKAEAFAADMRIKLQEALAGKKWDVLSEAILEQYQNEEAAIDRLLEKTTRLAKLRGGKDAADAAERDAADAQAVRDGVDPEIVKKRRALDDAAAAKEKIALDIEEKKQVENARAQAMTKAIENRKLMEASEGSVGANPEQLEQARKRASDATAEWEKSNAARVLAEQLAPDATRKIDAQTGAKVASLDEHQRQRIFAEERKARELQQRAEQDKARADQEEQARRARDGSDALRHDIAGRKVGREAEALLPPGVSREFASAVQRVSRGLLDGDQGGELKQLLVLMNQLADVTAKRGMSTAGEIANLRDKIANLQGQVSNLRSGK